MWLVNVCDRLMINWVGIKVDNSLGIGDTERKENINSEKRMRKVTSQFQHLLSIFTCMS